MKAFKVIEGEVQHGLHYKCLFAFRDDARENRTC